MPPAERVPEPAHVPYWLIFGRERCAATPLIVGRIDDQGILPVFGCEEEAISFLRHADFGGEWRVSKTSAREIVSWLRGKPAKVGRIALDPPPDPDIRWVLELVSVEREEFVRSITGSQEGPPR